MTALSRLLVEALSLTIIPSLLVIVLILAAAGA